VGRDVVARWGATVSGGVLPVHASLCAHAAAGARLEREGSCSGGRAAPARDGPMLRRGHLQMYPTRGRPLRRACSSWAHATQYPRITAVC
jgi:hypothetical protein